MTTEDQVDKECPLCMEQLDLDELNFFPCKCGYQICQFCWNRIKQEENGLCPACRQPYPDQPVDFKPFSVEELKKIQQERRKREQQRKQKMSENRKHLANIRVVQRNLVLVHGMPPRLCDPETLRKLEYFGQFGKIQKIAFGANNPANTASSNSSMSQTASASVYVTYSKEEEAVKAIMALNQRVIDGKVLRASLGTTKYCACFLQNKPCQKTDCMYLHEVADTEASFTKEDMTAKRHEDYERKVCEEILLRITSNNSVLQQRGDVFPCTSASLSAASLSTTPAATTTAGAAAVAGTTFSCKSSRDSSVTPQSHLTLVNAAFCDQQSNAPQLIASPVASMPATCDQTTTNIGRPYRGGTSRHHRKQEQDIKGLSISPIDMAAQHLPHCSTTADNSAAAVRSNSCLPTAGPTKTGLSSSSSNIQQLSDSNLNSLVNPILLQQQDVYQSSQQMVNSLTSLPETQIATTTNNSTTAASTSYNTSNSITAPAGSVDSLLPFSSSVASFFRQQAAAANDQLLQQHHLQQQQQQRPPSINSSFFSLDEESSNFYRERLKHIQNVGQQQQQSKLSGDTDSLTAAPNLSSCTSSSLLEFILEAGAGRSNTGKTIEQQQLANGLNLATGNALLERFSNNPSTVNNMSTTGPVLRPLGKPDKTADLFQLQSDNAKVKPHVQTDWQMAFGFSKSDDDLGFDPFSESSKALEDLLREEREKEDKQRRRMNTASASSLPSTAAGYQPHQTAAVHGLSHLHQHHGLQSQQQHTFPFQQSPQHLNMRGVSHRLQHPPPPQMLQPQQASSVMWQQLQQQQQQHPHSALQQASSSSTQHQSGVSSLFDGTSLANASSTINAPYSHETLPSNQCVGAFPPSVVYRFANPGTSADVGALTAKAMSASIPPCMYNGLNAQAAPFVPKQMAPLASTGFSRHQQHQSLSVKDMQEQFRSFFPEASVKFQIVPTAAHSSVNMLSSVQKSVSNPRTTTGSVWPTGPRVMDPRQSMFTRPPPPISVAVQQSSCFAAAPAASASRVVAAPSGSGVATTTTTAIKLSPNATELPPSAYHQAAARIGAPMSSTTGTAAAFGATPVAAGSGGHVYPVDYSNWSLAPTPPPGFAPTSHQSS